MKLRSIITATRDYSQNCHLVSIHFGCPPINISKCDFTRYLALYFILTFKTHFQSVSVGAVYTQASVVCSVHPQRLGKQIRKSDFTKVASYLEPFSNSDRSLK